MKNKFLSRIGQWHTPPYLRKCLTSLKALTLLLVMLMSVNVWGADVTYNWTFPFASTVTNADFSDDAESGATMGAYKAAGSLNGGSWSNTTKGSYFNLSSHFLIKVPISSSTTGFTLEAALFGWKSSKYAEKTVTITYYTSKSSAENAVCNGSTSTSGCYSVNRDITLSSTSVEDNGTLYIKIAMAAGNDGFESLSVTTSGGDDPDPTEPSLSVSPATIDFGTIEQNAAVPAGQDVEVTFANLTTNDVTASITGEFNISKSGSFTSGDAITVTPKSTATIGTIEGTLTVKATTDDITKTVSVTMTVAAPEVGVSFEKATSAYTDWTFTNFESQQTHSDVTAHTGSYFGTTGGKASGSMVTKAKIAKPGTLQFFISKQSTNTSTSSWKVSVSSDNSEWTQVGEAIDATSMTKGTWTEVNVDLTAYSNVYVKLEYAGSTATRCIDDVVFIAPQSYDVTLATNPTSVGTITAKVNNVEIGAQVEEGQTVTLSAAPNDAHAYRFKEWQSDDVTITDNAFEMPGKAVAITAVFEPLYAISVTTAGEGSGTATINGSTETIYVGENDEITLVAENATGSEFGGWSASDNDHIVFDDATAQTTTATVDAAVTITATFNKKECTILGTPQNVQVTDKTYSGAKLTWDAVTNADYYEVYIKKGADDVENDMVGGTEYTISATLSANTEYSYSVVAGSYDDDTYCASNPAEGIFTTADYPAVVLTLNENGTTSTKDGKLNTPITLPTVSTQACDGKVFVGWSENPIDGEVGKDQVSLLDATYTFTDPNTLTATIYAVYAKKTEGTAQTIFSENFDACEGTGGNDEKWSGSIASATLPSSITGWTFTKGNAANQCAKFGSSSVAGSAQTPALEFTGKATLTFRAGAWSGETSKTLNITTTSGTVTPTSITLADAAFTSYEIVITDATENPQVTIAAAQDSKNRFFLDDVVVKAAGEPTYSNYCTTCQAAVAVPTFNPDGGKFNSEQSIELTATEGDIYYTINDGEETKYTAAIALDNRGTFEISAYAKVGDRTSETITKTYTLDWAYTLTELVSEGAPTTAGRNVTVILTNEIIESLATSGSYVNGFFTMVGDKKIEVYCQNSPAEWEVGGKVSGIVTCPWKDYKGTWELCPTNWDWASYTAPAKIESLEITGDVDNKNYTAGQKLDFTGLTVWGVYNDNTELTPHKEDVTADVVWTEVTLTQGQVSATATATLNNVETGNEDVSKSIEITGLIVGAKVELSKIEITKEASKKDFFVGRNFNHDGIVVTATYSNGSTSNVTNACDFSTPTLENKGQETVTITYSEGEGQDKKEVTTSYTINVKYMNLSELVAEDVPTNTSVKVAFSDVEITGFYKNSSDKRAGVYVNVIGKNGSNIELYSGGTPSETLNGWQEGGKLASKGDYITGTWKYYDGGSVWEIDFGSSYAWATNIEYTAPEIYPTAIELSETTAKVKQSKSLDLEANFNPANATILNNLEWSSDNNQVTVAPSTDKKSATVTVAPDATVGTATITVKVDDKDGQKLSATCVITIEEYSVPHYGLYAGDITEGNYIFKANGENYFMNNTNNNGRLANVANENNPEIVNNIITTDAESFVWQIAKSGDYWTIKNLATQTYVISTASGKASLSDSPSDNTEKWTITYDETKEVYTFENLGRSQASSDKDKKYLRNNNNSGWACYGAGTGNAITLYKDGFTPAAALTSIEIDATSDVLTKEYIQGATFSTIGLKVLGNYSDQTQAEITSGITWTIEPQTLDVIGDNISVTVTAHAKGFDSEPRTISGIKVAEPSQEHVYGFFNFMENGPDITDWNETNAWTSSYTKAHDVVADEATVHFEGAAKQTSTITKMPVVKQAAIVLELTEEDKQIASVILATAQWGSKTKKITAAVSLDGENYTDLEVEGNETDGLSTAITQNGIRYVKFIPENNDNQLGIATLTFTTADIQYDYFRNDLVVGNYGTVCVPYAVKVADRSGATFWNIETSNAPGSAAPTSITIVEETNDLVAGKPYIFCAEGTTMAMFFSGDKYEGIESVEANGLYGNLTDGTITINPTEYVPGYFFVLQQKLYECGTNCTVSPNRGWVQAAAIEDKTTPSPAPRRVIGNPKGAPTGINDLNTDDWKNIQGARKYLYNNQIMIVNEGRIFNAQGALVK